jgi:hypothetical protein
MSFVEVKKALPLRFLIKNIMNCVTNFVMINLGLDADPDWIRIQQQARSGSGSWIRLQRIRNSDPKTANITVPQKTMEGEALTSHLDPS